MASSCVFQCKWYTGPRRRLEGYPGGGQGARPGGAKIRVTLSKQCVLIVNVTSKALVLKKDLHSRLDFDALNCC